MHTLPEDVTRYMTSFLDYDSTNNFRITCKFFESITRKQWFMQHQRFNKVVVLDNYIFFLKQNGQVFISNLPRGNDLPFDISSLLNDDLDITEPTLIPTLRDVKDIFGNFKRIFFVFKNGEVKALGSNQKGELGTGTLDKFYTRLILLTGLPRIKSISVGESHTVFLAEDHTVLVCGDGDQGKLGLGNVRTYLSPTLIPDFGDVEKVSAEFNFTLFLKKDGNSWICGGLGAVEGSSGEYHYKTSPTLIAEIDNVQTIATGRTHAVFLKNNGTVWVSGSGVYGQLGLGPVEDCLPTQIPIENVIDIYTRERSTFFIKKNSVFACGKNDDGGLGVGNYLKNILTPTRVTLAGNDDVENIIKIHSSLGVTVFLQSPGILYVCGKFSKNLNGPEDYEGGIENIDTMSDNDAIEILEKFIKEKASRPRPLIKLNSWYEVYKDIEDQKMIPFDRDLGPDKPLLGFDKG